MRFTSGSEARAGLGAPRDRILPQWKTNRMSVRMLAVELYRVMKEVEGLEKKIEKLGPGSSEKEGLERRLKEARSEKTRLKKLLEGAKS